jgi:hypothetical protein
MLESSEEEIPEKKKIIALRFMRREAADECI